MGGALKGGVETVGGVGGGWILSWTTVIVKGVVGSYIFIQYIRR